MNPLVTLPADTLKQQPDPRESASDSAAGDTTETSAWDREIVPLIVPIIPPTHPTLASDAGQLQR